MATQFTLVTVKDLQRLQGIDSYEQARRALVTIRDSFAVPKVLVWHLAQYFGLPVNELVTALK